MAGAIGYSQPAVAPTFKVGTVSMKFIGQANVNEQLIRANMQMRDGVVLDETQIDQDIRSLYKTGLFEFIEVKRDILPERIVNLVFELTPKFRVLSVRYEGNVKIKSRRLDKEIKTKPNTPLDERQVKEDVTKVREYYQKSGYNQVQISYAIERNRATGFGSRGCGVAHSPGRVVVLRRPSEFGAFAVAQEVKFCGALLGCRCEVSRLAHIDQLRVQGQHERSFDLPGVRAKAVFVGAEALRQIFAAGIHQRQLVPVDAVHGQAQAHTQVAPDDVHETGLPAVGVEQHQLAYATGRRALGHIGP